SRPRGRHAAHTALPTKRATFTTCARGQARCACWLWLLVHRIQAVVVEAKGLPEGEPTAVRYNSSGLSGREPHGSPRSDRDRLLGRLGGGEGASPAALGHAAPRRIAH